MELKEICLHTINEFVRYVTTFKNDRSIKNSSDFIDKDIKREINFKAKWKY